MQTRHQYNAVNRISNPKHVGWLGMNTPATAAMAAMCVFLCSASSARAQCLDWSSAFAAPPTGIGLNGPVYAMTQFDEDGPGGNPPVLIVGGHFTSAGGVAVNNLARWNGLTWSDFHGGVSGGSAYVLSLYVDNPGGGGLPLLYVGGGFTTAGGP